MQVRFVLYILSYLFCSYFCQAQSKRVTFDLNYDFNSRIELDSIYHMRRVDSSLHTSILKAISPLRYGNFALI